MKPALHPACAAFSPLTGYEVQELAADIKAKGLLEPITMLGGKILDGDDLWDACEMAGVEPRTVEYEGHDPCGFVLSKNKGRRHLTKSQLAMATAALANLKLSRPKEKLSESVAFDTLGRQAGLSRTSIKNAVYVQKTAPEIAESVKRGEVALRTAYEGLRLVPQAKHATVTTKEVEQHGKKALRDYGRRADAQRSASPAMQAHPRSATILIQNMVSLEEVTERLSPIIKELRKLAKCNPATIPIPHLAVIAHQIQIILDAWARGASGS